LFCFPSARISSSPSRPLCQKSCYSRLHRKLPSAPLRAPRRFRNPKIGQLTPTASPPAPLAIRKAPSASVESIEPRPPRPCEVGRPKGGEGKTDANLTIFFSTCCALAPQLAATPWGGFPPPPPPRKTPTPTAHKNAPCAPPAHPREPQRAP